jgi:hypothetical protein
MRCAVILLMIGAIMVGCDKPQPQPRQVKFDRKVDGPLSAPAAPSGRMLLSGQGLPYKPASSLPVAMRAKAAQEPVKPSVSQAPIVQPPAAAPQAQPAGLAAAPESQPAPPAAAPAAAPQGRDESDLEMQMKVHTQLPGMP